MRNHAGQNVDARTEAALDQRAAGLLRLDNRRISRIDEDRALRAAKAEGIPIGRIEIEPMTGKIIIVAGEAEAPTTALDTWMAANARAPKGH